MEFIPYAVALALALLAVYTYIGVRAAVKRRRKVRRGFGAVPKLGEGRREARGYWALYRQRYTGETPLVDDITWNDLDLDDIFAYANACHSTLGDVRLYGMLRSPAQDPQADMAARLAMARAFRSDAALRQRVGIVLAKLGRREGDPGRIAFEPETLGAKVNRRFYLFALLPLLCIPMWLLFGWQQGVATLGGLLVTNLVLYYRARGYNDHAFASVAYFARSLKAADRLASLLAGQCPEQAQRLKASVKPFGFLRWGSRLMEFDEATVELGMFDPLAMVQLPMLVFRHMARRLAGMGPGVLSVQQAVGEVDAAWAIASFRELLPIHCAPEFTQETGLWAKTLYHPLLEEPVANDGSFTNDALFTGSNASGKSTFIKALAINALLAQTIGTCCAAAFKLAPGMVASSMAIKDNIYQGDSYFVAELKSLKRLVALAQSGRRSYLFIDEILKGTNTVERIAASASVLALLHETDSLSFAATHDIELTVLLGQSYDNYHFRESVDGDGVHFDYRLHEGPATTRNAILLLGSMGFDAALVQTAGDMAAHFDATGQWRAAAE